MPRRKPGRPVSVVSREAVLTTAAALLEERGWGGFTVDEVARRSGVGKATIYKHWRGGLDVAADAWGSRVTDAVPVVDTGAPVEDLLDQVHRLATFYAGPHGVLIAQLLGAGVSHPDGARLVAERFFAVRRQATRDLIDAAKGRGDLRSDVETDPLIDLLFGPIVFRMFNGLGPLAPGTARQLAAVVLSALAT